MLWRVLCFNWANVIFSSLSPHPLTRLIFSSLREFQHGAFVSKNICAPEENACTAGQNINWFGEVSFDIQVYSTCICSTKIQSLGFIAFSKPNSFCNKILSLEQLWLEERTHSKQFHPIHNKIHTMGVHWSADCAFFKPGLYSDFYRYE